MKTYNLLVSKWEKSLREILTKKNYHIVTECGVILRIFAK